jgi:16S rRNA (guanine966-N2)-methyltransferase
MEENGLLRDGAVAVVEHEASYEYPEEIGSLKLRKRAQYGDTAISLYVFRPGGSEENRVQEKEKDQPPAVEEEMERQ